MFEKRVQKDQDSRWEEVVLIELQVIIIPKRPQHCPGRFMTASLNKQRVKEKKSFIEETKRKKKKSKHDWVHCSEQNVCVVDPTFQS